MQDSYKILGVSKDATDEEIEIAYNNLKKKYSEERFLEGEVGNQAAKNLTLVHTAYSNIMAERGSRQSTTDEKNDYSEIEKLIKEGSINKAQVLLDDCQVRDAEWHYLQSVVFYKKNWLSESLKQLEIAMQKDGSNSKYKDAHEKLKNKINANNDAFTSGNFNNANGGGQQAQNNQQMGGACGSCLECCAINLCINVMCNGCCR